MRSLFLKVFLWFWLATALVVAVVLLSAELTRPDETFAPRGRMDRIMRIVAQTTASTYEREGAEGLTNYISLMEREAGVRGHLFDGQGNDLSNRDRLPQAGNLISRAIQTSDPVFDESGGRLLVARRIETTSGRVFVFVDEPQRPRHRAGLHLRSLVLHILAALLTAGVLCYWLTRYLLSPVAKLRAVTRQVATGDLSARVSPLIGERRDEFAQMGRDFDQMAERIELLVGAQRRLLNDISHELRSPLARLGVALDLARKRDCDERITAALDRIERESHRLNEMVGQLLSLARWENGADDLHREAINLKQLVEEIAADADFEARSRNCTVRIARADDCRIIGNLSLMHSAIENVLRNAVRYTAENTIVDVSLRCEQEGENRFAVICVRDAGAGVPEKVLADIFRPFFRVEDARDRERGGVGLGLAITKRAVELHGGSVAAANIPEAGLEVEIRLPAAN
jgi:signal transduction histidine kinase